VKTRTRGRARTRSARTFERALSAIAVVVAVGSANHRAQSASLAVDLVKEEKKK